MYEPPQLLAGVEWVQLRGYIVSVVTLNTQWLCNNIQEIMCGNVVHGLIHSWVSLTEWDVSVSWPITDVVYRKYSLWFWFLCSLTLFYFLTFFPSPSFVFHSQVQSAVPVWTTSVLVLWPSSVASWWQEASYSVPLPQMCSSSFFLMASWLVRKSNLMQWHCSRFSAWIIGFCAVD